MNGITETDEGVILDLRVSPRASRDEFKPEAGGGVKVRLRAPPVDGKANAALILFLADALGVPKRNVEILAGETSHRKRVRIRGVSAARAAESMRGG